MWLLGDRLLAAELNPGFEVILQVATDTRKILDDRNLQCAQMVGVTHPGQLQQMGGVEDASAQDCLLGVRRLEVPARLILHANGTPSLEQHPGDPGPGHQVDIGSAQCYSQVGIGCRPATPREGTAVQGTEPLLSETIEVLDNLMPGLACCSQKRGIQTGGGIAALKAQRAAAVTP